MHSSIIELTLEPLDREDWAREDCFYDDEKVATFLNQTMRNAVRVLPISRMTKTLSLAVCLLLDTMTLSFSREKMLLIRFRKSG